MGEGRKDRISVQPNRRSHARGTIPACAVIMAVCAVLQGCKVISVAENEAMRERASVGFDAGRYAQTLWSRQALPYWTGAEQPLPSLIGGLRSDLASTGQQHGRRAGDGSPWSFVVTGEGAVQQIAPPPRGRIDVRLQGGEMVSIQVGPAVSGSALRDSLPFVRFDDFSNQLVYADVAAGLNQKAVTQVRPTVAPLKVGDTIAFAGVLTLAEPSDALVVTPYRLTAGGAS